MKQILLFGLALCALTFRAAAQCNVGEIEITIEVTTDDYGYETYWQLVPGGNPCGTGTIAEGGNLTMDCNSGGDQVQNMTGYGDNILYPEGPWCLIEGATYDIYSIDDYGDGQATFEVFADGYSIGQFNAPGATNIFTFTAQLPVARDMSVTALTTSLFSHEGDAISVIGKVKSQGTDPVTQFDLLYAIDGGTAVSMTVNSVTLDAGDVYEFEHTVPWTATGTGPHALTVWAANINGGSDLNTVNDLGSSTLTVAPAIPHIIDQYLFGVPQVEVIANSNNDLLVPRDLDFHPDPARNELWVILKETEGTGGATVKFTAPGEVGMTWLWQHDQNAWHFMSLPTGLAFGDNGNFSTCPGVFDANHNGGTPFTGPALWSSDPAIYAQPIFGGLGSHIDMLHVTPNSQGIAAERWNRFWVVDGYNGDIVMHDFKEDHGPGNDFHGDAIIRRYMDFLITKDPNDHIVSHCALDKNTGWLYVVDFGGQRVLRLDINSGVVTGPGSYGPWESYVDYSDMGNTTWEEVISSGLVQPAGIEVIGDRLLVSDHSNGDIVIYDISATVTEIGRIHTGTSGIMGITVGPDGRVWAVNATTHELLRVTPDPSAGVNEVNAATWSLHPNPTDGQLFIAGLVGEDAQELVEVLDATGRVVKRGIAPVFRHGMDVSDLSPGTYAVRIGARQQLFVIQR